MNIFITGATGFLGKHLIDRLKREPFSLFALVRKEEDAVSFKKIGVQPIRGSLENLSAWEENLENIDVIIHCAAPVEFWGPWKKFYKGIFIATKNLFLAAQKRNVKRFIYLSSESVLQNKKDLIDIDENEDYPKEPNSYYGKTKMLTEQFVKSSDAKMESIIIRPTFIWGPGVKALDTMIEKIKMNKFMWINNGSNYFEMVHVKNVAESIFLALTNGKSNEIYFVTDDNPQPVKEFLTKLLNTKNVQIPTKNINKLIAYSAAVIVELIWKFFSIKSIPPLSKFDLSFVAIGRKYNIAKIKNDLNYSPVFSEDEGLKEMRTK